jgi:hypothetical protein
MSVVSAVIQAQKPTRSIRLLRNPMKRAVYCQAVGAFLLFSAIACFAQENPDDDLRLRSAIERTLQQDEAEFCSFMETYSGPVTKEPDCREQFRNELKYKSIALGPGGRRGLTVELCMAGLAGSGGCALRVLRKTGARYERVWDDGLGLVDDVQPAKTMTNGFYDLVFGELAYAWTGSKYVCRKCPVNDSVNQRPPSTVITFKVASMESLNHKDDAGDGCTRISYGAKIKGATAKGVLLTMSCKTQRVVCGTVASQVDKADDGKDLTCGAIFHTGQTVRFEQGERGEYLVLGFRGFDGAYKLPDRQHLKPWTVESESVRPTPERR